MTPTCNRCGHHHVDGICRHRDGLHRCGCTLAYLCACGHVHGNDVCDQCDCIDWGQSVYVIMPGGTPNLAIPLAIIIIAVFILLAML